MPLTSTNIHRPPPSFVPRVQGYDFALYVASNMWSNQNAVIGWCRCERTPAQFASQPHDLLLPSYFFSLFSQNTEGAIESAIRITGIKRVRIVQVKNTVKFRKQLSPGAYIFQRPFLRGLFLEGLIFGGAYLRREIFGGACTWRGLFSEFYGTPFLWTY